MKLCNIKAQLEKAIQEAQEKNQKNRLYALHIVYTKIIQEEQERNRDSLTNCMLMNLLIEAAEQHQEAKAIYQAQGETELAQIEQEVLSVIQEYLPPQLSEAAIGEITAQIIRSIMARNIEDANRVITIAKEEIGNRSTGRTIAKVVRAQLKQLSNNQ